MNPNFLEFEAPIAELEAKIDELRHASHDQAFNIEDEIGKLQDKLKVRTAEIFRALTPWQVAQLARHPARPYTLDYVKVICEEFHALAGDRAYADDAAIVGGLPPPGTWWGSWATRKGATRSPRSVATSACRGRRDTARRCAS